jgi:hypothetical protein
MVAVAEHAKSKKRRPQCFTDYLRKELCAMVLKEVERGSNGKYL